MKFSTACVSLLSLLLSRPVVITARLSATSVDKYQHQLDERHFDGRQFVSRRITGDSDSGPDGGTGGGDHVLPTIPAIADCKKIAAGLEKSACLEVVQKELNLEIGDENLLPSKQLLCVGNIGKDRIDCLSLMNEKVKLAKLETGKEITGAIPSSF
jgi:hypothetical protein